MALETGSYINDLVITNPQPSDPKSAGDDHLRLLKATIKETLNGFTGAILLTAADTGTAAAHVLTPATALVSYTPMLCLLYLPAVTNTGAITVNVSGLGAKSIKTLAGADPTAGDIVAGAPVLLMYNGTNFINLAGSEFLSKTGNQTLTGALTVTSDLAVGGNETIAGTLAVNGVSATLPQATTIGTTTAAELGYMHGVTSAVQGQINAKGAITGQAWTGSHDFTGATPTGPTAAPGTNTTQFATTAYAVALAFASTLPAQAGNGGKFVTTDGANASWSYLALSPNVTGTLSVANGGTGASTFTDGGVLIGNSTGVVQATSAGTAGQVLVSGGAGVDPAFGSIVIGSMILLSTVTASNSAAVDIESTFSGTYDAYILLISGVTVSVDDVVINLQYKLSGAYVTTPTYLHRGQYSVTSNSAYTNYNAGSPGPVSAIRLGPCGNGASSSFDASIKIYNPTSTTTKKMCHFEGASGQANTDAVHFMGMGTNQGTGALTGLRILPASGNIVAGKFRLYGIANT